MKIVLANLPWKKGRRSGVRAGSRWPHIKDSTEKHYMPFPFYLAYAAALLKKNEFDVYIIDAIAEELSYKVFFEKINALSPQLLVVETSTVTLKHDLQLLLKFKNKFSITVCGPEAHLFDEQILDEAKHIDYVLFGEYEASLLELAKTLGNSRDLKAVKGLIYRQNGFAIKNPPRPLISELDWLPWPLREQLRIKRYNDSPGDIPGPCASMWASRGCPYQCSFCLWPQVMYGGNSYRVRGIKDVVDEMEYLVKELGFKSIYFDDDTWNVGRERIIAFCDELECRDFRIPWAIMARAELMDEELLERMKKAGLFSVKYGVESSSQELLDMLGKRTNLEKVEKVVKYTKYLGIKTHLTFTFGLLGETKKTIQDTINYAKRLNPTSVQFSLATPFPGTRFYEQMKRKGYILTSDWDKYDGNHSSVIRTTALTGRELLRAKKAAYQEWDEFCQLRLKKLKPLSKLSLIDKLVFSKEEYGLIFTVIKVMRYILRRLFFLPLHLRQAVVRNFWIIEETIGDKDLKIYFGEGRVRVYWRGQEVSKDVGMNTSLYCQENWIDSSLANWKLEKLSEKRIIVKLKWDEQPLRQEWDISIENNEIYWSISMQADQEVEILEYKAGIMLEEGYQMWKDNLGLGKFPKITDWEEIELYNPNSAALTAMGFSNGKPDSLPQLTLEALDGLHNNAYPQIQNSNKKINARILQMRRLNITKFSPGNYDYFKLKISLQEKAELAKQSITDYKQRAPLALIKEKAVREGIAFALKKILKHMNIKKLKDYYFDIVGILDGAYAYKGPYCVQIDLTNNCNNDCIGCWCNSPLLKDRKIKQSIKEQTLPLETVKQTIDELKGMGTREIYFAGGGEPFMHPHIMEIIEHVKSKGLRCFINTNFTLVTDDMVKKLVALKVDNLIISVWAGKPETYLATHPNKSEEMFYQIKDKLGFLNSLKVGAPHTNIYNVISSMNYQELEEMVDFAISTGSDALEFTVIDTIPQATDALMLTDEQRKTVADSCQRIQERLAKELKNKIKIQRFEQFIRRISNQDAKYANYDKDILSAMPCYIGWLFARILADGNVNFCLKAHRIPVGNIYARSFSYLWNSRKQQEFRKRALCYSKDDVFFSFIGNDPEAGVGCYRSCDDLARNVHMHKKIQSLTFLELKLLRLVLLWQKAKRLFKADGMPNALRKQIGKKKIKASYRLERNKMRVEAHKEGIKLFWADQECTQSIGLNSSLCIFGLWYDSSKANWQVTKHNDNEMVLKNAWKNIPINQEWHIKFEDDFNISWAIRLSVDSKIEVEESKASIMLSPAYLKWETFSERGRFPMSMGWNEAVLKETDIKEVAVTGAKRNGRKLPQIRFDFSNTQGQVTPQIQNSDRIINARVISARRTEPNGGKILLPGDYDYFSARINVGEKDV